MLRRKNTSLVVGLACLSMSSATFAQQSQVETNTSISPSIQTLPEVQVTTTVDESSESNRSYAAHAITVGSKISQSVRETPHSISVVTRQRLDDQNITKIEDVLKQVTGVNVTRLDGAGNFNTIQSRGFDVGSVQLDGLAISQGANYSTALDTAIYDRIEILRGPAGLLQGAGEPGGTINLVRKRARSEFSGSAGVMLGSWNTRRGEVDLTSKLNESGTVRGRVVGVVDNRESFVNELETNKTLGYGTVEMDLSSNTTLSLGIARQKIDSVVDQGLPLMLNNTLPNVSRSTFIGSKDNVQDMETEDKFAELEHKLAGGGLVKFALRQVDREMVYKALRANGNANVATGMLPTQSVGFQQEATNRNLDLYYTTPFQLWGRTNRVLVGANYSEEDSKNKTANGPAGTMNIYNPDNNTPLILSAFPAWQNRTKQEQKGIYGQLQLKPFESWTFLLGGRFSQWQTQPFNLATNTEGRLAKTGTKFTPLTSAIFELNNRSSFYASYSETFVGQSAIDSNQNVLSPRTGSQIEFGIKSEWMDKKVNTSLALFKIVDNDRAIADPANSAFSIAGGKVRSQGMEAEISGRVAPGWELIAGYAFTSTKILEAPASQIGQSLSPITPKHSVNLWSKHTWGDGNLSRWSVAGGLKTVSEFASGIGAARITAGGYTTVSGQIGYQIDPTTTASLTVTNLFDKNYYEKVNNFGRQSYYGEPRAAMLAVKKMF